jgi:hypothetical protein
MKGKAQPALTYATMASHVSKNWSPNKSEQSPSPLVRPLMQAKSSKKRRMKISSIAQFRAQNMWFN